MKVSSIAILILLIPLLFVGPVHAVDDPSDLLPRNNAVDGWTKDGPDAFYYINSLERIISTQEAAVVDDYRFYSLLSQYYTYDSDYIEIRIYEMESSLDAFGLYSVYADIKLEPAEGEIIFMDESEFLGESIPPDMHIVSDKEIHVWGDNYFVQLLADKAERNISLMKFAMKVQAKFEDTESPLKPGNPLEHPNRAYGTERIIGGYNSLEIYLPVGLYDPFLFENGNVMGYMSDMRLSPGNFYTQFVAEYEDTKIAHEAFLAFKSWIENFINLKKVNIVDSHGTVAGVDEKGRYLAGFRERNLLRVLFWFDSSKDMEAALRQF